MERVVPKNADLQFADQRSHCMRSFLVTIGFGLSLGFMASCSIQSQSNQLAASQESCRAFAQSFYQWYVETVLNQSEMHSVDFVLRHRSSVLAPELLEHLRRGSHDRGNVSGLAVGLDFDPFVNSQDPADRYVVENVRQKGHNWFADVFGIISSRIVEGTPASEEMSRPLALPLD